MKTLALALAALLCLPAAVSARAATPGGTHTTSHTSTPSVPAALRPVLYQTLARDAGPAYAIQPGGCATLPKQHLRACFGNAGVRFIGSDRLSLYLAAWGRGSALHSVTAVTPEIADNQARYVHDNVTEWWRVLPMGFEQGFTIAKRPAGEGELTLALASGGKPMVKDGTVRIGTLRYGKLVVTDDSGKVVPSRLTTKDGQILIAVNDAHAAYPLRVDPLVWLEQKVTAADGAANDNFGTSVAISGTTALVGAPGATVGGNQYQGAAYVFTESGGTWTQSAKLTAADGAVNDRFGYSVALAGTTALVGSPLAAVGGNSAQGAAYVFTESGGSWTQSAKLTAGDGAANDQFGFSVALDGATALVGAVGATVGGNSFQGAAYVFDDSSGTWSQTAKLTASDGAAGNQFGTSVALDGTSALVGSPFAAVGGNLGQGAAYVFDDSTGTWAQTQKLTAADGAANNFFGQSVALAGTTALAGANNASVGGHSGQGAAYVFDDSGGTWTQTTKLTASDGAKNDRFGFSVALSGTTALVGASSTNAAYVFDESGGTWTQSAKLTASDGGSQDSFGYSVALAGTTALIGADRATVGGNAYQGAAYFEGESDLGLVVSAPATAGQGNQYVSQAIATNNASAASPAVAVTVTVPAAASFVSASASQGSCSENAGTVSCSLGAIAGNGGSATANVTLKATGSVGDTLENTASVSHATPPLAASAPTAIVSGLQAQIQPPIAADGSSIFKAGHRVIPVKFTLTSGGEPTCDLPPATISLQELSGGSPGDIDADEYQSSADTGPNFRIDTDDCQYIYNLSTESLEAGTYEVQILIDGSAVGSATFGLD